MFEHDVLKELQKLNTLIAALPMAIVSAIQSELIETPEPETTTVGCQHPVDLRVDLGDGDWDCGVRGCRYRHEDTGVSA